ncbi:MAG TPA: glycerophosphodiester phosphodiesterase, partial [Geobacterales bacterium]|nr:glycerophosphodiester phosphodiesterase [Geobacterales bacterium]
DMIEFDVRRSADDRLFIMHDQRSGRTATTDVDMERSTAAVIETIRLRNGEPVPTLAELLQLVSGQVALNIEIKSRGAAPLVVGLLRQLNYQGELLISSFLSDEVATVHNLWPELPVAEIYDRFLPSQLSPYAARGFRHVSLNSQAVTQELVLACHAAHVRLHVWTVNDEHEMERLYTLGVDGIFSNVPQLLRQVRDRVVSRLP